MTKGLLFESAADLASFQERMHSFLDVYMAGQDFGRAARLFYPLSARMKGPQDARRALASGRWPELQDFLIRRAGGDFSRMMEAYREAVGAFSSELEPRTIRISRAVRDQDHPGPRGRAVLGLRDHVRRRLAPFLAGAWIHGSLATLDSTGYSDLDVLLLLKDEVLGDPVRLARARRSLLAAARHLYEFDPLQHHGFFVLGESDLRFYGQAFLPLAAFELAAALMDAPAEWTFRVRPASGESLAAFCRSAAFVLGQARRPGRLDRAFYLKGFLSQVMLLPALFLQIGGASIGKRESFGRIREILSSSSWSTLEAVSRIRAAWNGPPPGGVLSTRRVLTRLNPFLVQYAMLGFPSACLRPAVEAGPLLAGIEAFVLELCRLGGVEEASLGDR